MDMSLYGDKPLTERAPAAHEGVVGGLEDFLHSAVYTGLQRPINGITQFAGQIFNKEVRLPQLVEKPVNENFSTAAGSIAGTLTDLVLINHVVGSSLESVGASETLASMPVYLQRGITSGLVGGVFGVISPTERAGNYWDNKARDVLINTAAFGTLGAIAGPLHSTFGDTFTGRVAAGTIGGAAAGITSVALKDSLYWQRPSLEQLSDVGRFAVIGGLFGAATYVQDAMRGALSEPQPGNSAVEKQVKPESGELKQGESSSGPHSRLEALRPLQSNAQEQMQIGDKPGSVLARATDAGEGNQAVPARASSQLVKTEAAPAAEPTLGERIANGRSFLDRPSWSSERVYLDNDGPGVEYARLSQPVAIEQGGQMIEAKAGDYLVRHADASVEAVPAWQGSRLVQEQFRQQMADVDWYQRPGGMHVRQIYEPDTQTFRNENMYEALKRAKRL